MCGGRGGAGTLVKVQQHRRFFFVSAFLGFALVMIQQHRLDFEPVWSVGVWVAFARSVWFDCQRMESREDYCLRRLVPLTDLIACCALTMPFAAVFVFLDRSSTISFLFLGGFPTRPGLRVTPVSR